MAARALALAGARKRFAQRLPRRGQAAGDLQLLLVEFLFQLVLQRGGGGELRRRLQRLVGALQARCGAAAALRRPSSTRAPASSAAKAPMRASSAAGRAARPGLHRVVAGRFGQFARLELSLGAPQSGQQALFLFGLAGGVLSRLGQFGEGRLRAELGLELGQRGLRARHVLRGQRGPRRCQLFADEGGEAPAHRRHPSASSCAQRSCAQVPSMPKGRPALRAASAPASSWSSCRFTSAAFCAASMRCCRATSSASSRCTTRPPCTAALAAAKSPACRAFARLALRPGDARKQASASALLGSICCTCCRISKALSRGGESSFALAEQALGVLELVADQRPLLVAEAVAAAPRPPDTAADQQRGQHAHGGEERLRGRAGGGSCAGAAGGGRAGRRADTPGPPPAPASPDGVRGAVASPVRGSGVEASGAPDCARICRWDRTARSRSCAAARTWSGWVDLQAREQGVAGHHAPASPPPRTRAGWRSARRDSSPAAGP